MVSLLKNGGLYGSKILELCGLSNWLKAYR